MTAGLRVDVPRFGNTAFPNPAADALTFRDQDGSPVRYNTGALPETTPYWSPRVGLNWDVTGDGATQVRGGTGPLLRQAAVRLDLEPDRQHRRAVRIRSRPATPPRSRSTRIPTATSRRRPARAAASYELDVTDQGFRFPQTWRTNIGVDRRLPWGLIGTLDYIYNRDLNAPVYINANLPAAQSAYTGVDNRPRWVATAAFPACAAAGQARPVRHAVEQRVGNQITANYVIKNQSENRSWNIVGRAVEER